MTSFPRQKPLKCKNKNDTIVWNKKFYHCAKFELYRIKDAKVFPSVQLRALCWPGVNWESDHSTYFGLRFILFEHLELLEHRASLTAGKTMLFCVVYSRKKFVLSGCQCLFSLILVGNHRKRVTHY